MAEHLRLASECITGTEARQALPYYQPGWPCAGSGCRPRTARHDDGPDRCPDCADTGLSVERVVEVKEAILAVPTNTVSEIAAETGVAVGVVEDIKRRILGVPDKNARITADTSQAENALERVLSLVGKVVGGGLKVIGGPAGFGVGSRQHGGRVKRKKPYLVGEDGPELAVFDHSGYIVSNKNLREMAALLHSPTPAPPMPMPARAGGGDTTNNNQRTIGPVIVQPTTAHMDEEDLSRVVQRLELLYG